MEAPSASITTSPGVASNDTATSPSTEAPLVASREAPPASKSVSSDLAELDASMRELTTSTSELTSAMGISQASLSSLNLRTTARVAMAAVFPQVFHNNTLSAAEGFLALQVGSVVDQNLLLSLPEGINVVLLNLADASTEAVEHVLWTLSFFPLTSLIITGSSPTIKCSPRKWFHSLAYLYGLSSFLIVNSTFESDFAPSVLDWGTVVSANRLVQLGFSGKGSLVSGLTRFAHQAQDATSLILFDPTENLAALTEQDWNQRTNKVRSLTCIWTDYYELDDPLLFHLFSSLENLLLIGGGVQDQDVLRHIPQLKGLMLYENPGCLDLVESMTMLEWLHIGYLTFPLLSDEGLREFVLHPLALRPPLAYLEIEGVWPNLMQLVLELHLKQPQQFVVIGFPTVDSAVASLKSASKWLKRQVLHEPPRHMLLRCRGASSWITNLPKNLALFCYQPPASLVKQSPSDLFRLGIHWKLDLCGDTRLIHRQLSHLSASCIAKSIDLKAKNSDLAFWALQNVQCSELVVELLCVSVTKEEYSLAPSRPLAPDERCTTLPHNVWDELDKLTIRGALSLPSFVVKDMLNLSLLSLSIHAAEHFGAEGLRALCNLRSLQVVDLAHNASNKPVSGHTAVEMLRTLRVWPKLQGLVISVPTMLAVQELMAVMRVQALIDLQIYHAPRKAISELIALFPSMSSLWRVGLNYCGLQPKDVLALVESPPPHMFQLDLDYNPDIADANVLKSLFVLFVAEMDQLSLCGTGITPEMLVPAIMQELAVLPIEKKVFYTIYLSPSGLHFEKMREAVQLLLRVSWPMFALTTQGKQHHHGEFADVRRASKQGMDHTPRAMQAALRRREAYWGSVKGRLPLTGSNNTELPDWVQAEERARTQKQQVKAAKAGKAKSKAKAKPAKAKNAAADVAPAAALAPEAAKDERKAHAASPAPHDASKAPRDLSWTEEADISCTPTVAPPSSAPGAALARPAVAPPQPPAAAAPPKPRAAVAPATASNAARPRTEPPAPAPAPAPAAKSYAATAGGPPASRAAPSPVAQPVAATSHAAAASASASASRAAPPPPAAASPVAPVLSLSSDDGAASLELLLQRLNLSELSGLLKKHMVKDVGTLGMLSTEEMAEIGVPLGARKKLHQALHPPAERKAAEGVGVCVVCLERESVCLARECGHKAVCEVCVRTLKRCPMCRRETEFLKIYDQ